MRTLSRIIIRFPISIFLMASLFLTPKTVYADATDSPDLTQVKELAAKGSIRDEIVLAGDYFVGAGVKQDSKMAAYWYEKAAGHGSPEAQNQIGYFYQAGIGVPQDSERAFHWYQLSSASGYAIAKVNLAVAYLNGLGVNKNQELAVRLLNQAFEAGNGTAATYLGLLNYFGLAVKEDKLAGEKWFEAGEKLHDPMAAFNLGSLYSITENHPHDLARAADLLRRSADAGYVPAMHSLGLLLINHPELNQTPEQARTLLETAANAGSWKSSVVLAVLARDGRGTPVDYQSAYFHLCVAQFQGGPDAVHLIKHDLDSMAAKIGPTEIHNQSDAAKNWFQHHSVALAFVYKNGSQKRNFPAAAIASAPAGSVAGQLLPLSSS